MKLNSGEIHIWSTIIDERYAQLLSHSVLSMNEKRNAALFTYDIDAFLFSVRHNLLRIILGDYLSCDPSKIRFNSNHYQKPHIAYPNTNIHFNISSSSNLFVAVFCQQHTIGVDIEQIRNIDEIGQLTEDYFTKAENDLMNRQPQSMTEATFFNLWARKESLIKAIGKGLSIELNTIDVLSDNPIKLGSNEWYIYTLKLFDDCAGAITLSNPIADFSYFDAISLMK